MDQRLVDQLGVLAAKAVEDALASGLTWDQAIMAFGVASKAIAAKAASQGGGTPAQYAAHAEKRLKYGMDHSAEVLRSFLG
jgi:aromatic ring hydroxylase